jgi:tripartite-type tricarboxylate transporter receptor subunit TctC
VFKRHAFALVAVFTVALLGLGAAATAASAQDYPTRAVTVIVPSTAGGGTDIISRIVGAQLSKQLGQPFVIENVAGPVTGSLMAAHATPDGYTLLAGLNANMAVNPSLFKNLAYDPVKDFVPVGMMANFPFIVIVSNSLPVHSIKELIALGKSKPGEIDYASAGNGTGQHLSMELFKMTTGVNFTHVAYRGAQPAYPDIISGRVPVMFDNFASALGAVKSNTVRGLAVTGPERSPLLPDLPTVAEAGAPGYQYIVWFGLWAPKGTPQPIVEKLYAEIQKALDDPDVKEKIAASAGVPSHMPLADITPFLQSEIAKWAEVVKRGNVTMQ